MKNNQNLIESSQILKAPEIDDLQELISDAKAVMVTVGLDVNMKPVKLVTFYSSNVTEEIAASHDRAINESYEWAIYKSFAFSLWTGKPVCRNPNQFKTVLHQPIRGVNIFGPNVDDRTGVYGYERLKNWVFKN